MTYNELWHRLVPLYPAGEAKAIVRWVLEQTFGFTLTQVLSGKVSELSAEECALLKEIMDRLEKSEPVQYVLGKEQFYGRNYLVDHRVLIPRPETELLCRYMIEQNTTEAQNNQTIFDIGTGSGCIAITLALELSDATIAACDISEEALQVAQENARRLKANVCFEHKDILAAEPDSRKWTTIVSNPPYICHQEKSHMHPNVVQHEPSQALFVPDYDPLRYYNAIAAYSAKHLKPGGTLWLEINPIYREELIQMLKKRHFIEIETLTDQQQDSRFIKATLQHETTE